MVTGTYRELFAATAGAAAALTGLLFVAMTVASQRAPGSNLPVVRQIRASAALLAFTSTIAISLFGLVPDTNIGYPAAIVAIIGIFFTAAAIRSVVASRSGPALVRSQVGLFMLLLAISLAELIAGLIVVGNPASATSVQVIGYAVVTSLLVGIGRAWEFIGERDTGILASLGILAGRTAAPNTSAGADAHRADPGGPGSPSADVPGDSAGQRDREAGQRDREAGQRDREAGQRDREAGQRDREAGQRDRET